ncbi:7195_t:CDS:2 [Gigaspora rosea]|nr:7195_t:CDS:2 [Gigaspora rosea]
MLPIDNVSSTVKLVILTKVEVDLRSLLKNNNTTIQLLLQD